MVKQESELPDDISRRLEAALTRAMGEATQKIRAEVGRMFRFANMDEVQAARQVLEEKGQPMKLDEIVEELKAGGIWRPASGSLGSSADTEIKRSVARGAAHGVNLKYIDRDSEIIGLA